MPGHVACKTLFVVISDLTLRILKVITLMTVVMMMVMAMMMVMVMMMTMRMVMIGHLSSAVGSRPTSFVEVGRLTLVEVVAAVRIKGPCVLGKIFKRMIIPHLISFILFYFYFRS